MSTENFTFFIYGIECVIMIWILFLPLRTLCASLEKFHNNIKLTKISLNNFYNLYKLISQPSSSGRSVEILSKMNLDTGLVISTGNNIPTLFPTLTALSLDSGLNPEYQMCLKKLNKKDPITRAKVICFFDIHYISLR